MATSDIYGNIDFSQYRNWPKVVSQIDGKTYYEIPGRPGEYFDPLKGKNGTITRTPEQVIEQKKKAEKVLNPQPGTGGQIAGALAPIAGTAGGILVANKIADWTGPAKEIAKDAAPAVSKTIEAGAGGAASGTSGAAAATGGGILNTTVDPNISAGLNPGVDPSTGLSLNADTSGAAATTTSAPRDLAPTEVVQPDGSVVDTSTGMTTGQAIQTGAGVIQVIAGINQFNQGDKIGGGINTVAGATNIAAGLGSESVASVLPGVNAIAGGYGAYKTAQAIGSMPAGGRRNTTGALGGAGAGAGIGAAIGSVLPGPGTAIGAGVGAAIGAGVGLVGSLTGSSKDKYQMMRDAAREVWQKNGIINKDFQGTLADGTAYDFGKDGKGLSKVDFNDPLVQRIAALSNVIAAGEGATGKAGEAIANLYLRAAISNAGGDFNKALANIQHFAKQRQFTPEAVQAQLDKLKADGAITEEQYKVWSADKNIIWGTSGVKNNNPTNTNNNQNNQNNQSNQNNQNNNQQTSSNTSNTNTNQNNQNQNGQNYGGQVNPQNGMPQQGLIMGGVTYSPQDLNTAKQRLSGMPQQSPQQPQSGGILNIPGFQNNPTTQPPQNTQQPTNVVNYGAQNNPQSGGILNMNNPYITQPTNTANNTQPTNNYGVPQTAPKNVPKGSKPNIDKNLETDTGTFKYTGINRPGKIQAIINASNK